MITVVQLNHEALINTGEVGFCLTLAEWSSTLGYLYRHCKTLSRG